VQRLNIEVGAKNRGGVQPLAPPTTRLCPLTLTTNDTDRDQRVNLYEILMNAYQTPWHLAGHRGSKLA